MLQPQPSDGHVQARSNLMRFAVIFLFGCALFLFTGCEADEVDATPNQMSDSNTPAMEGNMPTDEGQGRDDDTTETSQMSETNDDGANDDDMQAIAMEDDAMSGDDPETTAIEATTDATEVAEMLDTVCVEECELYAECLPNDPDGDAELCIELYCVYAESLSEAPEVENDYFACLSADLALYQCLVNLECNEFERFYDLETADTDIPCAMAFDTYANACEPFYGDAEDIQ